MTDGTLQAPTKVIGRPMALTRCKACGSGFPTSLLLAAHGWTWSQHARACPARPLEVSLNNLRRWADHPPAGYIVDQELDRIRKLLT